MPSLTRRRPGATDFLLIVIATVVAVLAVGLGAFYYYDRYVHIDVNLADRQAQQYEDLVRKNPQNADLRVAVAAYYLETGQIDAAVQQAHEASSIVPDHQGALMVLAQASQMKGDLDGAVANLMRVVELNMDNPMMDIDQRMEDVFFHLGSLLAEQGKNSEAVDVFGHALRIDPVDADAHYALAVAYQKLGDHTSAVTEFQTALRFVPSFHEAYAGLAESFAAISKTQEAAYASAMVAFTQGKYAAAAASLEQVTAQAPDIVQAYLGLGLVYEKLGRRDQAITALHRFLSSTPDDVTAEQALGRLSKEP